MTKEKILAKSRAENGDKDVFNAEVQTVAVSAGYLCRLQFDSILP